MRTNRNKYPLRKIVARDGDYEILECGHRQRERQDIYGPTNANRRRCRRCHTKSNTTELGAKP